MKILALDSSGMTASVALMEDGQLVADYTVNYKKTHSQTLLPMLDTIAQMIGLELESVDAIAIAAGPGSFTGLRIGSATAKGLGLALDKPVIEVPTIYGLANNLFDTEGLIVQNTSAISTIPFTKEKKRLLSNLRKILSNGKQRRIAARISGRKRRAFSSGRKLPAPNMPAM